MSLKPRKLRTVAKVTEKFVRDGEKQMNQKQIEDIRERLESGATYPHEWTKRVTIKQMAEYLKAVHPELHVMLEDWSRSKDSKAGRLRIPGSREYTGYKLKVWRSREDYLKDSRYPNLINHDTTETYRHNYEVAKKIIKYEREKEASE